MYIVTFITKLLVVHVHSIITLTFRNISISMSNQITNDWIIFDISKCKISYTIYYIDFAHLFYWLVFSLLDAQWYCRLWGLRCHSEKNYVFVFHWVKYQFVFHLIISAYVINLHSMLFILILFFAKIYKLT